MTNTLRKIAIFLGICMAVNFMARETDRVLFFIGLDGGDDTDAPRERSGLGLRRDFGTGCEYLISPYGGITARLGRDGKQICGRAP